MTIAYKGFNQDLQGYDNFQYEVGKTYEWDGESDIWNNGFHYCDRIVDIDWHYDLRKSRVCEVEILGREITDDDDWEFATDKIRIVRELSRGEINKYFEDNCEELVKDENWKVREIVAKMGFGLDILVRDEHWRVRAEVARHGVGLDILIKDENEFVRTEVVNQCFCLDILVSDKNRYVREQVARHGRDKDLDILVKDKDFNVRYEVARHGRPQDLDILVNDNHSVVKLEVVRQGRYKDLTF